MQERLVAGQVKPPLVCRERLVSFQFVLGELNWRFELNQKHELIVLNEQRLAVREVLLLQLLEPWYFSLIFHLAQALCLDLPTGWSTR
jgi:hypothetical protein